MEGKGKGRAVSGITNDVNGVGGMNQKAYTMGWGYQFFQPFELLRFLKLLILS